ncbi:PREDICTED: ras-related protein Rab-28-like [Ceratosolen solmsi marchali]|uniref:Ras-related protein Rab-28-like n=1 Tax=Ceratosolen solmsi marchali TaxID=326594 RepID=A0AAJ7E2N1_9HYME|nr:PREDICTED: ras-related protein Rab-28-like [Ceratosolen solmsi marchali]
MSDTNNEFAEKRLKIVLVGDLGAGKTSIAVKFCTDEFTRQYTPTSGIDFFLKNMNLGCQKNIRLQLWDVSGLSLRSNMLDKYIFEANIILLVYDITNSSSFDILEDWVTKIRELSDDLQIMPVMAIVGNKCDMEHQRTVKRERSHRFAAENGFHYQDMSARTGESVSLCIANLAAKNLGIRLTKFDQDLHKPIITAEIGDSVDMPIIDNRKIIKRRPNKKQMSIHHFRQNLPMSKSTTCSLQ